MTANSRENLQLTLETARQRKEALEVRQSKLIDKFMAADLSPHPGPGSVTRIFMGKNNRLKSQIASLEKEIDRCRESLDALPFS